MFDLLILALAGAAFAGAFGYVWACDRLVERPELSPEDSP